MKKGLAFALLLAFMLAACEKFERRVYVNEDAVCCGGSDPMHNIPWLKNINDSIQKRVLNEEEPFERSYLLFSNDTTGENMVVEVILNPTPVWVTIFKCDGTTIDSGAFKSEIIRDEIGTKTSSVPPHFCRSCYQFFETHTFVNTIATYSITLN